MSAPSKVERELSDPKKVKKINKIISASALAVALLLSATACSTTSGDKASDTNSSSQIKAVDNSETQASSEVRAVIARTVNEYYSYVSDSHNLAEIEKANEPIKDHAKDVTDTELNALVAVLPAAFKYFDTSSPELIKNAYSQLTMGARILSRGTMHLKVNPDAFAVDGDTATVDISKTETVLNGKKIEAPSNSGMFALKLKKNGSGSWVMIAEPIPGLSASNSFAAAASGASAKK